jgi:hypothetical protein
MPSRDWDLKVTAIAVSGASTETRVNLAEVAGIFKEISIDQEGIE